MLTILFREGKKKERRQKKGKENYLRGAESRSPSREGTQGRHQADFRAACDGIPVYFNINDPGRKAASTGARAPLQPGSFSCTAEEEKKESGRGVRESAVSCKYVFESLSPAETQVDILPPLRKRLTFVWSL